MSNSVRCKTNWFTPTVKLVKDHSWATVRILTNKNTPIFTYLIEVVFSHLFHGFILCCALWFTKICPLELSKTLILLNYIYIYYDDHLCNIQDLIKV